jgi:hypothetical protein
MGGVISLTTPPFLRISWMTASVSDNLDWDDNTTHTSNLPESSTGWNSVEYFFDKFDLLPE